MRMHGVGVVGFCAEKCYRHAAVAHDSTVLDYSLKLLGSREQVQLIQVHSFDEAKQLKALLRRLQGGREGPEHTTGKE